MPVTATSIRAVLRSNRRLLRLRKAVLGKRTAFLLTASWYVLHFPAVATKRINADVVSSRLPELGFTYLGGYTDTKHPFSCQCNTCSHQWNAFWGNVVKKGCPKCGRARQAAAQRQPAELISERLAAKGIRLLAVFTGVNRPHELECATCQHRWKACLSDVLRRTGCPECARRKSGLRQRLTDEEVKRILDPKGIRLLTPYVGGLHTNRYQVQCAACQHRWSATFATLRYNGCPNCAGVTPKSAEDYQALARLHGGALVQQARNTNLSSLWECAQGHRFSRAYSTITRDKTFCTSCQNNRAEAVCRRAMETLFQRPFPKIRLKMDGYRYPLELDGYCAELKIAFEHQGYRHYRPDWRPDAARRHRLTCKNDRRKVAWCARNGIILVAIPELFQKTTLTDLEALIRTATAGRVEPTGSLDTAALQQMPMPVSNESHLRFQQLVQAAAARGIELLSDRYRGTLVKYEFRCRHGHAFDKTYKQALRSLNCPDCPRAAGSATSVIGTAHQRLIRDKHAAEDQAHLTQLGWTAPVNAADFVLTGEKLTSEHCDFIQRYEWLGNAGFGVKWCFAARFNGLLGGVVLLSEPYRFEKIAERQLECLIQRGACAAWTPKNLGSRLVSFAVKQMVENTEKRLFFAYADPAAGEIGTIYQACNFSYLGTFKKIVYTHNGQVKSAQTVKRTSRMLPWLKQHGIQLAADCFTAKGYLRWSKIPETVRNRMREHVRQKIGTWKKQILNHGKYVLIRGASKVETKRLHQVYGFAQKPYPKRTSASTL